jgi:hypothetical protein
MKNKVLNKEQVQELIDLGFDVSKYSSVSYELCNNPKDCSYKTENQLFLSDNRNGICECGYQKEIKTLTIGDIIDALPELITIRENKEDNILFSPYVLETDMKTYLRYIACFNGTLIEVKRDEKFINMLFDLLKWCIVNKHIKTSTEDELNKLK